MSQDDLFTSISLELNHIDILMRISCNLHEGVFPCGKLIINSDGKEVDISGINKREYLKGKINELKRDHEARNIVDTYRIVRGLRRLNNLERIW